MPTSEVAISIRIEEVTCSAMRAVYDGHQWGPAMHTVAYRTPCRTAATIRASRPDRQGCLRSVVKSLQQLNCLSKTDKHAVELYAVVYSALRKTNEVKEIVSLSNACGRLLAQMGLNPSARAALKMNPPKKQNGVESKSFLNQLEHGLRYSRSASRHLHINASCSILQGVCVRVNTDAS